MQALPNKQPKPKPVQRAEKQVRWAVQALPNRQPKAKPCQRAEKQTKKQKKQKKLPTHRLF